MDRLLPSDAVTLLTPKNMEGKPMDKVTIVGPQLADGSNSCRRRISTYSTT